MRTCIYAVIAAIALGSAAFAQTTAPAADPHVSHEENTGQDPTKPLTRLDLRYKFQDLPGGFESNIFTVRVDVPFKFDNGWKLSTRTDLPFMYNDIPSRDNPNGDHEFGLSDTLFQALLVTPPMLENKKLAFALGTQVIFPTATEDQFGSGKFQLAPSIAAIYQVPEIRPGSFVGVLVREQFSFAGNDDRDDINDLIIEPLVNVTLPNRFFVTIAPEIRIDVEDGDGVFIPADLTIGWKANPSTVVSLQMDVPIVDDYEQYDWQMEFRIGFFF